MNSGIWIGDVLRALSATDGANRNEVLALLGFAAPGDHGPGSAPAPDLDREQATGGRGPLEVAAARPGESPPSPRSARASQDSPPPRAAAFPLLTPVRAGAVRQAGLAGVSLAPLTDDHFLPVLPHYPLFARQSARAILQAALSRQVEEGPLDLTALVETVARGKPVTALRKRPVPTLRFGVQILVDLSSAMEPFLRDQEQVTEQITRMLGREKVRLGYFAYSPLRGTGPGPEWTWRPYQAPRRRTPILLLSDLGIGGPLRDFRASTYGEWRDFAGLAHENDSEVVAFVVYPPDRWPAWLPALMRPVTWDRRTTARTAGARR